MIGRSFDGRKGFVALIFDRGRDLSIEQDNIGLPWNKTVRQQMDFDHFFLIVVMYISLMLFRGLSRTKEL
jgi:hypothetical protein